MGGIALMYIQKGYKNGKNVLVTGATGLVGKELLLLLLKEGYKCWIMGRSNPEIKGINFIQQDLGKDFRLFDFPDKMDYVVHLAQADNHERFPEIALQGLDVNVRGMIQLLNYSVKAGVKKFLFASSGGIYGTSMTKFTEDDNISISNDLTYYLNTKLCTEILTQNYKSFFDIITFRIFFAYGEGQKKNMLFARLVDSVKQGREVEVHSLQDIKINPIYKEDVAHCIYAAMNCMGSEIFNIAGSEVLGIGEIVQMIGNEVGIEPKIKYLDDGQKDIVADTHKMLKELWVPQISIAEGIKRMV